VRKVAAEERAGGGRERECSPAESAATPLRARLVAATRTRVVPATEFCKVNSAGSALSRVMLYVSTLRTVHEYSFLYGRRRRGPAAGRSFMSCGATVAVFCERSLPHNEGQHRSVEVLRTSSTSQVCVDSRVSYLVLTPSQLSRCKRCLTDSLQKRAPTGQ
jgi:hypothetical protein